MLTKFNFIGCRQEQGSLLVIFSGLHAHFPWVCVAQVPHFGKHIIAKEYEDFLCDKS